MLLREPLESTRNAIFRKKILRVYGVHSPAGTSPQRFSKMGGDREERSTGKPDRAGETTALVPTTGSIGNVGAATAPSNVVARYCGVRAK